MSLNVSLFSGALDDINRRPAALLDLQAFLASGGTPNLRIKTPIGSISLLNAAAGNGWDGAVGVLINAGADINENGGRALQLAAGGIHLSVVDLLLGAGIDLSSHGGDVLLWASLRGHLPIVERLLAAGVCPDAPATLSPGWPALEAAASNGHLLVVERLLAAGADVHVDDEVSLRLAADNDHPEVVEHLIGAGADLGEAIAAVAIKMSPRSRTQFFKTLNAVPAAIPEDQRQYVLDHADGNMPALEALMNAKKRQASHRRHAC